MGKGKPRKFPDKRQNNHSVDCRYRDTTTGSCERMLDNNSTCNGNEYNCFSAGMSFIASLSTLKKIKEKNSWYER